MTTTQAETLSSFQGAPPIGQPSHARGPAAVGVADTGASTAEPQAVRQAGTSTQDPASESVKDQPGPCKIAVRDLCFYYRDFQALNSVDLDIPDNQVTAFIGPSGCGKSTMLRCLNRIYELYPGHRATGEVRMDGMNTLDASVDTNVLRSKIGMVFQKPTPFPMSIYDNIAFGVKLYERLKRHEMDERVEWCLRRAALWDEVRDKLRQSGANLSGGQQQRLCIARAIAVKPQVLLLDEPASALDPVATSKIEELVHELRADYTIVIVTHNMQQAARVAGYTAFFHLGEIVEYNDTDTLFTRPQQKRTEDYITGRYG